MRKVIVQKNVRCNLTTERAPQKMHARFAFALKSIKHTGKTINIHLEEVDG